MGYMYLMVGSALSSWTTTENLVAEFYLRVCCPAYVPVEGALTTLQSIKSFRSKVEAIKDTVRQVLYGDDFKEFHKSTAFKLHKLCSICEIRNKLAHGKVVTRAGRTYFSPFHNNVAFTREDTLKDMKRLQNAVYKADLWNIERLGEECAKIESATNIARLLLEELRNLYSTRAEEIQQLVHLSQGDGLPIPIDPSRLEPIPERFRNPTRKD